MEFDNIYKLIGGAVAFLFIIYIISKTIQSNTRIIEGLKMNDDKKDEEEEEEEEDDSSSKKSSKNSSSNKNSDDKEWVSNTNDSIKTIKKNTNDYSEKIKKHKDLYKKIFVAKRENLNVAFLNVLFVSCYENKMNDNLSVMATLKQQIDLLDYGIGGNNSNNN
jgi:hypothetical protein